MSKRKRLPSEREALRRGREEARRVIEQERAREPLLVKRDELMAERKAARQRLEEWALREALSIVRLLATRFTCSCGKDCFVCQARGLYAEDLSLWDRSLAMDMDAVLAAERRFNSAVDRALGRPEKA